MRLRDWTIRSGNTLYLTTTIRDTEGNALGASQLDSLTLTLVDETGQGIINELDGVDVLNANNGTVDESGNLSIRLDGDAMAIVDSGLPFEWHDARLAWTWTTVGSPALQDDGFASIKFRVTNLAYNPALITIPGSWPYAGWSFWRYHGHC